MLTGRERPDEVVAKIAEANRRYPLVEQSCVRCGDSLGLVSEAEVRRGKKRLCPRCVRTPKYPAEERFCEWCGESLGVVAGWIIHAGGGRFCNRSHAKKWEAENHPEAFRKDHLRTGKEMTCPGCSRTRYYAPSEVPKTEYCPACLPSAVRAEARVGIRDRQIAFAREEGTLLPHELLVADAAPRLGLSRPSVTAHRIRSGQLTAERRKIAGVWEWVLSNSDLRRFQRDRTPGVDVLGRTHYWDDRDWVASQALDRGWVDAHAARAGISKSQAREQILAAVDARRRRPVGATPKEALREDLRAILFELADRYASLTGFSENELAADVGELAWQRSLSDFRQRYPADRFGDFDFQYRRNVIGRIRGLIGNDIKALRSPAKKLPPRDFL